MHMGTGTFTDQLSAVATGGITETGNIMATPIGGLIYLVLALIVIFFVVGLVIGILMWAKKNTGQKRKGRGRRNR